MNPSLRRSLGPSVLAAALGLLLAPVSAAASDVELEIQNVRVIVGQGRPTLVLHAKKGIASATAKLALDGGRTLTLESGRVRAGGKASLPLDVPTGKHRLEGTLAVTFVDRTVGQMPLSFEVELVEPLRIEHRNVDARAGSIEVAISGRLTACDLEIERDFLEPHRATQRFEGVAAGTFVKLSWPADPTDVLLRVFVKCTDDNGIFNSFEVKPYDPGIPHEDVEFASGKAELSPDETPKLDRSLEEIRTRLRRYGAVIRDDRKGKIRIQLFVAGHTDTVGDPASNRALSLARARSIALYFREKGLDLPIRYVGLGEDLPKIETPDETDEPRNRRAEYWLRTEPPARLPWQSL